jgi:hypothetical protein
MDASSLTRRVLARFHHADLLRRVVSRHVEAAVITPEKLNELLLKVRKGATSTFSWKNIADVLTALGGKITKTVGLISVDDWMYANSEAEIAVKRTALEKAHVSSLPSNPKHGQLYVTSVGPTSEEHGLWTFKAAGALGNDGWLIEMPNGKTWTALPSQYDVGELRHGKLTPRPAAKISIYDTVAWLKKEGHWDALASEALKMEVHDPSAIRTRDSTGSCGVCFQNVKIKPGDPPVIVLHGYKRPGTGQVHGNCFGMGYPPFELSVEATKNWLVKALIPSHARSVEALKDLESGVVTELEKHGRKYKVGDPGWEGELRGSILSAERTVQFAEAEVEVFEALVSHWKVRPLPKEGARHINWYFEGQK